MKIFHGLKAEHQDDLLNIYSEAFESKYLYLLKDKGSIRRILQSDVKPEYAICALSDDGKLMGVLSYSEKGNALFNFSLSTFCKEFGLLGGVYKLFLMWFIFNRKVGADELYIDHIVVDSTYRSQGVGKLLLDEVEALARSKSYDFVGLDVIDENPRALVLYQKIDFEIKEHKEVPLWISNKIGVTGVTSMLKKI